MRKLIAWNLMTLDGCFEGEQPWDLAFHSLAWGEELEAFSLEQGREIGTLLFGRKTYEGMAAYWTGETGPVADMMNGVEKAVASRTLLQVSWNKSQLLAGDAVTAVRELKARRGKDIFVFGSAELLGALLPAGLVDEYRIGLVPVVLGKGRPLFEPGSEETAMRLLEARPLRTGSLILRYAPQGKERPEKNAQS